MNRCALTLLFLAACVDEMPELPEQVGETVAYSTSTQGSSYQGSSYQGSSYQGSSYQGSSYQGSSYQGSSYQGMTYGGASVSGSVSKTTIYHWRQYPNGTWEYRSPNQRCIYYTNGTTACQSYNLATQVSPLAGTEFPTTFIGTDGVQRAGKVRIASFVGSVQPDNSLAMHKLVGTGASPSYVTNDDCRNGCGYNTDLFLYQVELVDTNGFAYPFCADGGKAYALAGTWSNTGQRTDLPGQMTFACTRGTIAKCTRWGYRPFGYATDSAGYSMYLPPYHQSCVRAAAADYCGNGTSFTKDGTLVDVYDYEPHQPGAHGLIPRTYSYVYQSSTALKWESRFDTKGAYELDFMRYNDLGSYWATCPQTLSLGTAPTPDEPHILATRGGPVSPPFVSIDTTTVCAHSEETIGRALHPECSSCTHRLWSLYPTHPCFNGGAWDATCKQMALDHCHSPQYLGLYPRMALHGECVTGAALYKYDTACTMTLAMDPALASCFTSSWTSTCTAAANARCTGGKEGTSMFGTAIGFCGNTLQPGGVVTGGGSTGGGGTVGGGTVGGGVVGGGGVVAP